MKIVLVHLSLSALAGISAGNASADDVPCVQVENESTESDQDSSVKEGELETAEPPAVPGCQSAIRELLTGEPHKGGFREPCMS